jgi:hypothetical protein
VDFGWFCGPSALLPDRREGWPSAGYSGFGVEPR